MSYLLHPRMNVAVDNVQGYRMKDGSFVVKELGVAYPEIGVGESYFFKPPPHQTISFQREAYNKQMLHRLPFADGKVAYHELSSILKQLTRDRHLYAKGLDQCVILSQCGFPVQDLEHGGCLRADQLPDVVVTCPWADHTTNQYCAERKALKYANFIKRNQ